MTSGRNDAPRLPRAELAEGEPLTYLRHAGSGPWRLRVGDTVLRGDLLAQAPLPTHAASSGIVIEASTERLVVAATRGGQADPLPPLDADRASTAALLERIEAAGICGLGGAGYPTHGKLIAALRANVHTLVINAVECEPGISCDRALWRERQSEVIAGIVTLRRVLGNPHAQIGSGGWLGDVAWPEGIEPVPIAEAATPTGEERHLIAALGGPRIEAASLPVHHGYVVFNLATALAVHDAVANGRPLVERVVTVAGANRWVPIGVSAAALLGPRPDGKLLYFGGALSGEPQDADAVVSKTTNALGYRSVAEPLPCIHCGACDAVCPEALPVSELLRTGGSGETAPLAEALGMNSCVLCGLCGPVCPSRIDLVGFFREARGSLREAQARQALADRYKSRFDARTARLARAEAAAEEAGAQRRRAYLGRGKDAWR